MNKGRKAKIKLTDQQKHLKKILTTDRYGMKYDDSFEYLSKEGYGGIAFYENGGIVLNHKDHMAMLNRWSFNELGDAVYIYSSGQVVEVIPSSEHVPF